MVLDWHQWFYIAGLIKNFGILLTLGFTGDAIAVISLSLVSIYGIELLSDKRCSTLIFCIKNVWVIFTKSKKNIYFITAKTITMKQTIPLTSIKLLTLNLTQGSFTQLLISTYFLKLVFNLSPNPLNCSCPIMQTLRHF